MQWFTIAPSFVTYRAIRMQASTSEGLGCTCTYKCTYDVIFLNVQSVPYPKLNVNRYSQDTANEQWQIT